MRHTNKYLVFSLFAGVTAIAVAREMGLGNSLRPLTAIQYRTVNGYSYQEPTGDAVPAIAVFSDNRTRYSRIGYRDRPVNFRLRATYECMGDWSHEGMGNPEIRVGRSTSYRSAGRGGGGKPIYLEGVPFNVDVSVPLDGLQLPAGLDPVKRCNMVVEDYTLQGKPPGALLQNGFWIKVDDAVPASLTPACTRRERKRGIFGDPPGLGAPGFEGKLPVWIRCMPTGFVNTKGPPPREGRPATESDYIKRVALTAANSPVRHTCPATVVFKGTIDAGRAVKGSYRLVGSDGYASSTYPFDLAHSASRAISWQRRVELPNTMGSLSTGGGGNWPKTVTGWLQLEVTPDVPNADVHRSDRAQYRVDCLKPPSGG